MSLYIGNLSSRIRRDNLEHVFQRFGRCNVRLKDGYGFVVYEFPPNAEKALRALHKSYICGEQLILTWSNKQPRPYKRFARTARSHERHGRDSARGDYGKRDMGSSDRQGYGMSSRQPENTGGRLSSAGVHDQEAAYHEGDIKEYVGEEDYVYGEDFVDDGSRDDPNLVGNDRWGEQFNKSPNENDFDNTVEFDRYEPHQDYDGKNDDEKGQVANSDGTPAPLGSQERRGHAAESTLNHPKDAKFRKGCYKCGGLGHKMRNCPQVTAAHRKFTRFDHRRDADINRSIRDKSELERTGSRSSVKLGSSRDATYTRRLKNDVKSSGSGKHRTLIRSGRSPVAKETGRYRREDNGVKKRSMKEIGSPKKHSTKKARRSVSSPLHSDYTASKWHSTSHSSKHVQRSHPSSRSTSVTSGACPQSSDSRFGSTAHHSRSRSSKSRSSSPTSLSLSVSLGRPLPSSSNKVQLNVKGISDNATTPESKEILTEQLQPIEGDAGLEDSKVEKKTVVVNNENLLLLPSSKSNNEMEKDQHLQKDNNDSQMVSNLTYEVTNPSTLQSEKGTFTAGTSSPARLAEMDPDAFVMKHVSIPIMKSESRAPIIPCSGQSTSISSEELCMVLKHYGLDCRDENDRHLPPEAYFGSARLWPWEIIYYRRLKKGPISIENYARRVDQNREFGIVDKYVRSSSGWEELSEGKP